MYHSILNPGTVLFLSLSVLLLFFFFQMQVKIVIVGIKNTKGANVILKT